MKDAVTGRDRNDNGKYEVMGRIVTVIGSDRLWEGEGDGKGEVMGKNRNDDGMRGWRSGSDGERCDGKG